MKLFKYRQVQFLPIELNKAWCFFSNPANLSLVTPGNLGLTIIGNVQPMTVGQLYNYQITIAGLLKVKWVTEITHVNAPFEFVDIQRKGPFSLWKHHHSFKQVEGGVEVVDEVEYSVPFGMIGHFVNSLYVRRALTDMFTYRRDVLAMIFPERQPFDLVTVVTNLGR
jgi:ligand-binding SRPBCC domain-containing protein